MRNEQVSFEINQVPEGIDIILSDPDDAETQGRVYLRGNLAKAIGTFLKKLGE